MLELAMGQRVDCRLDLETDFSQALSEVPLEGDCSGDSSAVGVAGVWTSLVSWTCIDGPPGCSG